MSTQRAYTWGIVTYAHNPNEFQTILDKARHWAFALHDKDTEIQDDGTRRKKPPHYHIIATFENEQSWQQVKAMVVSDQNTFAQPAKDKDKSNKAIVRGLWKYLIHDGENPEEKYIYPENARRCDNIDYWKHRCEQELDLLTKEDSFFEDLTATEGFTIAGMGRKYGRDFMKNMNTYLTYRNAVLREQEKEAFKQEFDELIALMQNNGITVEEFKKQIGAHVTTFYYKEGTPIPK